MDLIENILTGLLIYFAFEFALTLYRSYQAFQLAKKEVAQEIINEIDRMIPVKVEVHHDCYYFFHDTTDEFILQGHNREEIIAALVARYGNQKKLAVNSDDPIIRELLGNEVEKIKA
jgi:hypothetical protein